MQLSWADLEGLRAMDTALVPVFRKNIRTAKNRPVKEIASVDLDMDSSIHIMLALWYICSLMAKPALVLMVFWQPVLAQRFPCNQYGSR